jgi:hypothetical protein
MNPHGAGAYQGRQGSFLEAEIGRGDRRVFNMNVEWPPVFLCPPDGVSIRLPGSQRALPIGAPGRPH